MFRKLHFNFGENQIKPLSINYSVRIQFNTGN